eukprot:TRINITY_DN6898_c0_g1_i1.p1 TRINITY_DN6898_c0_g1~~TRINITY_DN6898_c0_g1_i1.p1  ORF type:complete len:107 (+),score=35.07 TRINITY_DN6898_c0_g1_i1:188-508(+)
MALINATFKINDDKNTEDGIITSVLVDESKLTKYDKEGDLKEIISHLISAKEQTNEFLTVYINQNCKNIKIDDQNDYMNEEESGDDEIEEEEESITSPDRKKQKTK